MRDRHDGNRRSQWWRGPLATLSLWCAAVVIRLPTYKREEAKR